jgi:hypothetical protein
VLHLPEAAGLVEDSAVDFTVAEVSMAEEADFMAEEEGDKRRMWWD